MTDYNVENFMEEFFPTDPYSHIKHISLFSYRINSLRDDCVHLHILMKGDDQSGHGYTIDLNVYVNSKHNAFDLIHNIESLVEKGLRSVTKYLSKDELDFKLDIEKLPNYHARFSYVKSFSDI